jgi:hypothetical protein
MDITCVIVYEHLPEDREIRKIKSVYSFTSKQEAEDFADMIEMHGINSVEIYPSRLKGMSLQKI